MGCERAEVTVSPDSPNNNCQLRLGQRAGSSCRLPLWPPTIGQRSRDLLSHGCVVGAAHYEGEGERGAVGRGDDEVIEHGLALGECLDAIIGLELVAPARVREPPVSAGAKKAKP